MAIFGLDQFLQPCTSGVTHGEAEIIDTTLRKEDQEPLLGDFAEGSGGHVKALGSNAVDSERCNGPGTGGGAGRGQQHYELEALATPPVELVAVLPEDHVVGSRIRMCGPHGRVEVQTPAAAQPGERITYLLAPTPEYRVEIPPGAGPGSSVRFQRGDGVEVTVPIPPGKRPGDFFEVVPPALMVQVPTGAVPGDHVIFRHSLGASNKGSSVEEAEWCRAQVPKGLRPGNYFAARLPQPKPEPKQPKAPPSLLELAMSAL